MSEIALRTTEKIVKRDNHTSWRPQGSTIVCCSTGRIRRKWLEICCDLVSPKKRDKFKNIPGWTWLVDAWTRELHQTWLEFDRPSKDYPLGWLLMDPAAPQSIWQALIEPIGVLGDLPYAPESDRKVHDTWLWSEHERKSFFIVVNDTEDDKTIESWQSIEERDGDTGEVLPELAEGEERDPIIKIVTVWKKQVKYWEDLQLSSDSLAKIADPDVIVHPKHDKPVPLVKFVQPDIAKANTVEIIK